MRTATLVIAALIASGGAGCTSTGPVRNVDLLIVGGTVIDPASRTQSWNSGIAINDGIIVALHASPDDFSARARFNAGNQYILPAFVDVRAHWDAGAVEESGQIEIDSRRSLYYGVTRVRNLMLLRATPAASSPGDVRREIARLVAAGADAIEVVASLTPESLEAAILAADEAQIPLALHVASADELTVLQEVRASTPLQAITVTGPVDPTLYRQIGATQLFYVVSPNAAAGFADGAAAQSRLADPFLLETLSAGELDELQQDYSLQTDELRSVAGLDLTYDYARDAARSGAILLTGTDAGSPHMFAGYSVHEELWALADAGIEPVDVLASASSNAALLLGRQNNWGSIEAGHTADILVLKANPLADIRNTRRISEVIKDGRIINRAGLLD
ncbi:MAG: amidohydrolase family protein [Woeseiaceae bacterium]